MINYYLITKPGIILGNLLTVLAGFLLGSRGVIQPWLLLETLLGITFVMASACICNNYIDRHIDSKMRRTKNRPIAQGTISYRRALLFAAILLMIGTFILATFTNALTVAVAGFGFFVYVILYSLWKCRTVYGTAIGSIAGAVPPVVGYCAVSNEFDMGAAILFAMLVLWQMPHFFSIALLHLDDYTRAGIPVLPVAKGIFRTKMHMILYITAFTITGIMLTYFNYTGYLYAAATASAGLIWLALMLCGLKYENNKRWERQMFVVSLLVIGTVCLCIPLDGQ